MAVNNNFLLTAYGEKNPSQLLAKIPLIVKRDPTGNDTAPLGQLWVNTLSNAYFVLTSFSAGQAIWTAQSTGSATQASLELTGGSGTVLKVDTGGNTLLGGTLAVSGASTLSGALTVNSGAAAIGIGTDAVAKTITVGNATGATAVHVTSGTGGVAITGTNGAVTIVSGTGAMNIATDAAVDNVNIGTGSAAKTVKVGSTSASSTLALQTPTGTNVVAANGVSITTAGRGISLPGAVLVITGAGDPNGAVTAAVGSLYLNSTGSSTTNRMFINTDAGTTWTYFTSHA